MYTAVKGVMKDAVLLLQGSIFYISKACYICYNEITG